MQSLIEPNIHPILVHFAYALTVTGALSLFVASILPSGRLPDSLKTAGDWMLAFGAIAVVLTVAAGFQAYYTVNHDGPSHEAMTTHRNWAVATAAAIIAVSLWRWAKRNERPGVNFSVLLLAAAASLSVTAWWGGNLVFGHGLGVARMPMVTGEGHDHDHAPGQGHGDEAPASQDDAHDDGVEDDHGDKEPAPAADIDADGRSERGFDAAQYPQTPEAVVDAYAAALRAGDEQAVLTMLAPDVIIAEGGGAERSVDEYAGHHMPADMAFTAAVEFSLKKRNLIGNDDIATVISESQVHGEFRDRKIHSRMMETMVLHRIDGRWRIAHIHWSSAPITGEHEH